MIWFSILRLVNYVCREISWCSGSLHKFTEGFLDKNATIMKVRYNREVINEAE